MKKTLIIISFLAISFAVNAQTSKVLSTDNGIEITADYVKLKEDTKKDTYLVTIKTVNKNDYNAFYKSVLNHINPFFCTVTVRNADEYLYITGTRSNLLTKENSLYYLKKNNTISVDKEVKVPKGQTPIITATVDQQFYQLEDLK